MRDRLDKLRLRVRGLPRRPAELSNGLRLLGELRELGWQRSVREGRPVDATGAPVPWMNYAAISVLADLVDETTRVFEYGSGYSTRWLAARAYEVHAVEHDERWFEQVRAKMGMASAHLRWVPSLGDPLDAPASDAYVESPAMSAGDRGFDLIIVDGVARRSCLEQAPRFLSSDGVIVLDDTERPELARAGRALVASGRFREFVVQGPKPSMGHLTRTTFFVRRSCA